MTSPDLLEIVQSREWDRSIIQEKQRAIHEAALAQTDLLDGANFRSVSPGLLEFLFDQCDGSFFDGAIRASLRDVPVNFSFSKRMTSAGGKTAYYKDRVNPERVWFEIAAASTVLFNPAPRTVITRSASKRAGNAKNTSIMRMIKLSAQWPR